MEDTEFEGGTETAAAAALGMALAGERVVKTEGGREFLIIPEGFTSKDVSEPNGVEPPSPRIVDQGVTIQTSDSLADYVNRFKGGSTLLFADVDRDAIVASIDYHAAAKEGLIEPGRVKHRATLALPRSVEWQTWDAIDGKLMGQLEFARFLEENAADIEAPSGADLLEACRDLQAKRKVDFTKAVRTSSDNESFEYSDTTTATTKNGSVEIPSRFMLRIPVYFGGRTVALGAFLRWKLEEGAGLLLGVKLHNPEHVRQAEFRQVVGEIAGATDTLALYGKL